MKKAINWYKGLSNRLRNSVNLTVAVVGSISTVLSILGISLADWTESSFWGRLGVVVAFCVLVFCAFYFGIGKVYKDSVHLSIRNCSVTIGCGDIFQEAGWRVIGCDTHFDTRIDDVIISKKSLHGQLVTNHGDADEIKALVDSEAHRRNLSINTEGLYDFPLGTILRYDSTKDNHTYLLLAMTELDEEYKSYTNMAKYEHMLMTMWREIDRVYASNPISVPLLGDGITRFKDGPKDKEALLKCMLCTLNNSGVSLNSEVKVVLWNNGKDIPLYEFKDMFRSIPG